MKADKRFINLDKRFWANVRIIGQGIGYTDRRTKQVRIYTIEEMMQAMTRIGLGTDHLSDSDGNVTALGLSLQDYFEYRANILNTYVEPHLMDAERASEMFNKLKSELDPTCPLPMNKQRGDKKALAYLTCIVNMLIEVNIGEFSCDYDPRMLTTITQNNKPLRTLARRVDGCFPNCIDPIAIWEIKEYYHTTTFGSRVADGVYETLLDGFELEELRQNEDIDVEHLLIVDSYYTWWVCGRSYLCRMVDMINMGYVDEVLFGYETIERLPEIVKRWVAALQK